MGRRSAHQRLATRFTHPRLVTDAGTVFVPPRPIDLERHFSAYGDGEDVIDHTLSAFERLAEAERFQLVLSLGWGRLGAPGHTLDLGLLRDDADMLFVTHQVNDDAGTSLILAHLSPCAVGCLFSQFIIDYLSSRGSGYAVSLPARLPHTIWVARPDLASHATVATGLLGLVAPSRHEPAAAMQGFSLMA